MLRVHKPCLNVSSNSIILLSRDAEESDWAIRPGALHRAIDCVRALHPIHRALTMSVLGSGASYTGAAATALNSDLLQPRRALTATVLRPSIL